ncbi:MAG: transposase [Thermodesulfobacteriota bacterium]|nr:transposase [Thermodesulfobacteriota bacterium]
MHRKNIKKLVVKQLKSKYPNWIRLTKEEKKRLAKAVVDEIGKAYDYSQALDLPIEELTGIDNQKPLAGVRSLSEMADYINNFHKGKLFDFDKRKKPYPEIKDQELKFIDEMLDNGIINTLIAPDGYSECHRETQPYQLFRMELLKILKYPEISYRKFCTEEYFGKERQQNRRFVRLSLKTKYIPDHSHLSHFRSDLLFKHVMNISVYFLHHFYESGRLENTVIHAVDSTELPIETKYPLCTVEIKGKKVRIYSDLDCDCGKRRNKRDKSPYVVGYRLHTLTAMNPSTGHSFPLVSVVAAANHHDSLFLKPLIKLAQAMGIEMKLITADEAYHDNDGSILEETGVHVIAPPSKNVDLPVNVMESPVRVTFNDYCEIPMKYLGSTKEGHEFCCSAKPGECFFEGTCRKSRTVPFDKGTFQPVPSWLDASDKAIEIRKNCERPFNLMKKREGLENTRVRSQHGVIVRSAFTTIVTLLIEMAGTRRKLEKKPDNQKDLFAATG